VEIARVGGSAVVPTPFFSYYGVTKNSIDRTAQEIERIV
jgi:hypothetical protein